ncbi:hypothetical protein [Microbacterium oxydans]|uniref:hypothetical protein n=1 Tax=Microbacterium oxydans TaxID=82380 RepID=UPI00366B9382
MTTTLERYKGQNARNYCALPTIDVEIIDDDSRTCSVCDGEVQYDVRRGQWAHDPADFECEGHEPEPGRDHEFGVEVFCDGSCNPEHRVQLRDRCTYCGGEGALETTQHAWHDATTCARCGGVVGYAIGD